MKLYWIQKNWLANCYRKGITFWNSETADALNAMRTESIHWVGDSSEPFFVFDHGRKWLWPKITDDPGLAASLQHGTMIALSRMQRLQWLIDRDGRMGWDAKLTCGVTVLWRAPALGPMATHLLLLHVKSDAILSILDSRIASKLLKEWFNAGLRSRHRSNHYLHRFKVIWKRASQVRFKLCFTFHISCRIACVERMLQAMFISRRFSGRCDFSRFWCSSDHLKGELLWLKNINPLWIYDDKLTKWY